MDLKGCESRTIHTNKEAFAGLTRDEILSREGDSKALKKWGNTRLYRNN